LTRSGLRWSFWERSEKALEKIHELQSLITHERKNHLLAYACGESSILLTEHQTQCDNIRYLLSWAEGEIWVIQRTSGNDTNLCLSRVIKLVLHVLVGSAVPLMQLMQKEHTLPLRVTKYDNGMLVPVAATAAAPVGAVAFSH